MKFFHGPRKLATSDRLGYVFFAVFYFASWARGHDPFLLATTVLGPFVIDCLKWVD